MNQQKKTKDTGRLTLTELLNHWRHEETALNGEASEMETRAKVLRAKAGQMRDLRIQISDLLEEEKKAEEKIP